MSESNQQVSYGIPKDTYVRRLTPSPNVSFWSRKEYTLLSKQELHNPNAKSEYVRLEVHGIYLRCCPNFAEFGGMTEVKT
ncbi:hypothetical protein ONZ45_g5988 [Pleurotus djamor]|nr:hypothetical protein ONZ45_g5988 [Pleurotus djamor]